MLQEFIETFSLSSTDLVGSDVFDVLERYGANGSVGSFFAEVGHVGAGVSIGAIADVVQLILLQVVGLRRHQQRDDLLPCSEFRQWDTASNTVEIQRFIDRFSRFFRIPGGYSE